jgi:hypothetical protein
MKAEIIKTIEDLIEAKNKGKLNHLSSTVIGCIAIAIKKIDIERKQFGDLNTR